MTGELFFSIDLSEKIMVFNKKWNFLTIKRPDLNKIKQSWDSSTQKEFNHFVYDRVKIYLKTIWINYDLVL